MPTYAHATIVAHLSKDPEAKIGSNGKPYVQVVAWTKDRDWRDKDKTLFTTWRGMLSGPQAEWLARDGKKKSLVVMSGTVRVDMYMPADGEPRAAIEFTRLEECRVLDRQDDGEQAAAAPVERRARPVVVDEDESTPF
jgi:single-stranded DNA-binding protein